MEEEKDLRRIGIPLGQRKNVKVAVSDIEVLQNQQLLQVPVGHVQDPERSRGRGGERTRKPPSPRETRGRTYIDSFMRETWRDGGTFFFGFAEEEGEFLDCGHGNVSTVVAGQKGLAMVSVAITER